MTVDTIQALIDGATPDSLTEAEQQLRPFEDFGMYQLFLHRLAAQCRRVVEIGTWKGYCTEYIAAGLPADGVVVTVDLQPLRFTGPDAHKIVSVGSDSAVAGGVLQVGPVDVLFIDGGHAYAEVAADYAAWAPQVRPGGLILFDDTTNPACPGVGQWLADTGLAVTDCSALHPVSGMAWMLVGPDGAPSVASVVPNAKDAPPRVEAP